VLSTRTEPQTGAGAGRLSRTLATLDRDRSAIVAIVLLALLAFAPWWAAGRVYAPLDLLDEYYAPWAGPNASGDVYNTFTSDAVTQYLVYRAFAERSFAEDGYIGWRDAVGGGRAEFGNTMAGYADWTMQLHRVVDFWSAWHLGLLGQFLIAALGMYAFLRSRRMTPLVALLGAVAFAANTQFVLTIYHRWHLAGFAWVPWLAWAMYLSREGRWWAWPLAPVFLALSFLGGNLQTNLFTGLVVCALWLGWLAEGPDGRARLRTTAHVAAWSALGLALAAFALVPETIQLLATTRAGLDRVGVGYRQGWLQPLASLLFVPLQAFPSLLGSPRSLDLAKALSAELFMIAYFGFLPMLLAFRVAFMRSAPASMRWLIALGLLLPLTPLVGPLYHRVQLVFVFGGVWAAAWYWQNARTDQIDAVLRTLFRLFLAAGGIWLLASIVGFAMQERLVARAQQAIAGRLDPELVAALPFYAEWLAARTRRLVEGAWIWQPRNALPLATALLGFAALRLRTQHGIRPAAAVLSVVVAIELGVVAAGWVTAVEPPRTTLYPVTPELVVVRERVGDGRVTILHGFPVTFLPPNTHEMVGFQAIQQYETVAPPSLAHDAEQASAARLGALAVTHAVTRPGAEAGFGWVLDYRGARLTLWRNPHALPRYAALPEAAGRVVLIEGTQNRRQLRVPAGTSMLRVLENWDRGWRFRVADGEWRPVRRAADGSMLAPIEAAADAVVELRYRPDRRGGGWLSLLAVVALAGVAAGGAAGGRPAGRAAASGDRGRHI
jgi:hypothetical protein